MTYIYQTLSASDFVAAFERRGRAGSYSTEALLALYDYYSDLARHAGRPVELDVVAICSEWGEYDDLEAAAADIGAEPWELERHGIVLQLSASVLVSSP